MALEPPELVTLLPEEEKSEELSRDLRIVRRLVAEVAVLVTLKIGMIIVSHRVMKTVREMNKVNFPRQRTRQ